MWFGHDTRHDSLSKTILQGTLEGGRRCVSLSVWVKSQDSVHKPQFLKRKESRSGSNRGPSAYQPIALPLGHTGSHERRIQAMEMKCYCKIPRISYKDHVTNEEVRAKMQQAIGPHEDLLTMIKRRILQWYGHVSRSSGLAKTIFQGTVKDGRRQGRQRKRWEDNMREWTGLEFGRSQRAVENRKKIEKTGRKIICGSPTTLAVKGLMMMMNSLKTQSPAYRISLGR